MLRHGLVSPRTNYPSQHPPTTLDCHGPLPDPVFAGVSSPSLFVDLRTTRTYRGTEISCGVSCA